jgi:hypothetical protein
VSGGRLFAYDYVKRETVTVKKLPVNNVLWPGLHITEKGVLYFAGDQTLYRMNLPEGDIQTVEKVPDWILGFVVDEEDNKLYGSVKSTLFCIDL